MTPTLADVKVQLRLEPDFNEHDDYLTSLVGAAKRSIEREYYCVLVESADEQLTLPTDTVSWIIDADIKLALQMMVAYWYLNPTGAGQGSPSDLGVSHLLFPLMEHTV